MSAVDNVADSLANTHIASSTGANNVTGGEPINAAENDAVIASAAEGRRLYIGNLAYATTEGDLKEFFTGYSMYVNQAMLPLPILTDPFFTANPPQSRPILAPPVLWAMPLSICQPPMKLKRPLANFLERKSLSVRFPFN